MKTRHLIDREKDAINLLRAEYAHLARPDRVQALADSKLGLQPLALSQIATVDELPDAQPKVDFDRPHPRIARIHGRQLHPRGHRRRLDASGEVTGWPRPRSSPRVKPKPRTGRASIPQISWLTPPSRGCGAFCRRISASISNRQPRAAVARRQSTNARLKAFARELLSTRLDRSGARIRTLALGLFVAYAALGAKLLALGLSHDPPQTLKAAADDAVSGARPDLLDRNGAILATDVKTMSVFAEPNRIIDKDEAVELITAVLPDVDAKELRERLSSKKGFIWVKRQITPKEQAEIFHLGLPGVGFLPENKRVYPNGPIGAHVIGFVDKDNVGIAGMEKYLDQQSLTDPHVAGFTVDPDSLKPVRLSLDLKATHALRDELLAGLDRFHAKAAAGMIVDVNTGEVLALESLPDFDPNDPGDVRDPTKINRINVGVYEMGSTFKALSLAMALESGKVNLGSHVDARDSLRYGRFTIHDFHATHRVLTVPEVFTHSSNIGAARLALMVGIEGHKAFLRKMGQLDRLRTELPESAEPLVPKHWALLNTMTIAFGQGLNVAPIQAVMAVCALANGGDDDDADLSAAHRRGGGEGQPSRHQRADVRIDALPDALQRDPRVRQFRQHSRLLRRRQDRDRRQDHPRALFGEQGFHHLHGDHAGRQAEVPLPDHLRRSAGRARRTMDSIPPPTTPGGSPAR